MFEATKSNRPPSPFITSPGWIAVSRLQAFAARGDALGLYTQAQAAAKSVV